MPSPPELPGEAGVLPPLDELAGARGPGTAPPWAEPLPPLALAEVGVIPLSGALGAAGGAGTATFWAGPLEAAGAAADGAPWPGAA
jgi:hypothetical protein